MRTSALPRSKSSEVFMKTESGPETGPIQYPWGKSMTIHLSTWLLQRKWMLLAIGLPVLVALWWAFRPEKLWINERVNEPAPFAASSDPEPIFTARFEAKAQQTSGRATIYKKPGGGQYLTLSDFTIPSGSDFHLLLARGDDQDLAKGVVKS